MDHSQVIKFFGLLLISLYIYMKILNIKDISKLKIASAVIFSLIMSVPLSYTPFLYEIIFLVSVCAFVSITTRSKISLMISGVIISVGISLGINILVQTAILYGLILPIEIIYITVTALQKNTTPEDITSDNINLIIVPIAMALIPYLSFIISAVFVKLFFKMKRLKNGFIFIQSKEARWIGIIFSIIIMISRSFWGIIQEHIHSEAGIISLSIFFLIAINICTIGIHIWWRNHTTMLDWLYNRKNTGFSRVLASFRC